MLKTRLLLAKLEYQGTGYLGWQVQNDGPSIQAELHRAISRILQKETKVYAPSRTDAGVHARGQVFTFTAPKEGNLYTLLNSINSLTPDEISVKKLVEVDSDFYPRRNSQGKRYSYVIHHDVSPPALTREFVWWVKKSLDLEAMEKATSYFIGEHDFTAFRGVNCTANSPVKFIQSATMSFKKEGSANIITFDFVGSGFVRFMIRNMVGILVLVGKGDLQPLDVKKALDEKSCPKKLKAVAGGLCLEEIFFDPDPFADS